MNVTDYFIVATSSLGLSYGLYHLFFRNETRFSNQRLFLIGSVALSVLLPLTNIRIDFPGVAQDSVVTDFGATGSVSPALPESKETAFTLLTASIPYIYITVSALMLLTLVINLIRIFHLYRCSDKIKDGKTLILRSSRIKSPFSFFRMVFIPDNISGSEELESILIHERVHADNLHSIDNIIMEVITAIMWFNPVLWMLKKSLQLIHEYQADEGTLRAGVEKTSYQALLVNQLAQEKLINISSSFNNNLKKRMIMMTKSKNTCQGRSGILRLLPVSAIMLIAVAVLNGVFIPGAAASGASQEKKQNNKDKNKEMTGTGYASQSRSSKQGKDTINYIVDGVSMENIDNLSPDSIESVNVLKDDRTIIIRSKSFARKQVPDSQIRFSTGSERVLYLKDGNPISEEELRNIDPSDIARLDVIKRKESIQEYTDKDFDGVILITTKK